MPVIMGTAGHIDHGKTTLIKALEKKLQVMGGRQEVFLIDKDKRTYVSGDMVRKLELEMIARLEQFHAKNPIREGLSRGELSGKWARDIPERLFFFVLDRLIRQEKIVSEKEILRLPGHSISLAADEEELRGRIMDAYSRGGIQPPTVKKLLEDLDLKMKEISPVLRMLQGQGRLIKINEDFYFASSAIEELKEKIILFFKSNDEMGPVEFKDLTGLSRKFAIPLLEFMDKEKLTIRVGDKRKLRGRG
jgi:selenocysteine-specific elongation factor